LEGLDWRLDERKTLLDRLFAYFGIAGRRPSTFFFGLAPFLSDENKYLALKRQDFIERTG